MNYKIDHNYHIKFKFAMYVYTDVHDRTQNSGICYLYDATSYVKYGILKYLVTM